MFKEHAEEAAPIVIAALNCLLEWAPTRGREGADLRAVVSDVRASVLRLLQYNELGNSLARCFDLAVELGITVVQVERVRLVAAAYEPKLVGAIVVKHAVIQLVLVTQGRIISAMNFVSRGDVEAIRAMINISFSSIAEAVADRMDAMTYRAIVALHAAISFYLVEKARPLPRMMNFRFNQPMTTLTTAYKLYGDAARADELRYENRVVHPAFMPHAGRALSA